MFDKLENVEKRYEELRDVILDAFDEALPVKSRFEL